MNLVARLGAFGGGLVLVFGAAMGVGHAVGPVTDGVAPEHGHGAMPGHDEHAAPTAGGPVQLGGLAVAADGFALHLDQSVLPVGQPVTLAFTVTAPDGAPLRDYVPTHTRELHLVVVRRDGQHFAHLHPTRDAAGRWTASITLTEPGPYKAYADFQPFGAVAPVVLAADLTVPGDYRPAAPPTARTASVDGYAVTLTGDLVAGKDSSLMLTVRRAGAPVTDLEPYLGAYGHLVVLRDGDLGYLHTHPLAGPSGPDVGFAADVPTPGAYRLFLDFQHAGVVRTAAFSLEAS